MTIPFSIIGIYTDESASKRPLISLKGRESACGCPLEKVPFTRLKKGLSFISNRHRRKEGTFCASELAGIEPTPAHSRRVGYACLNLSATATSLGYTLHRSRVTSSPLFSSSYLLCFGLKVFKNNVQLKIMLHSTLISIPLSLRSKILLNHLQ